MVMVVVTVMIVASVIVVVIVTPMITGKVIYQYLYSDPIQLPAGHVG